MTWWVWALIVWALTASVVVAWLIVALAVRVETLAALRAERDRYWATEEGSAPVLLMFGVNTRAGITYVIALYRRLTLACGARLTRIVRDLGVVGRSTGS